MKIQAEKGAPPKRALSVKALPTTVNVRTRMCARHSGKFCSLFMG